MAREDFETPTGLVEECDFIIDEARFGTVKEYMDGQVPLLIWEGHSPDEEEVTQIMFPIGSGWNIRDRGARVEHDKENKTRFIRNSVMGHLIRRCVDDLKIVDAYPQFEDGSPREAALWKGFGFHMKREKITYPNLKKDEATTGVETERLMPVAIIKTPAGTAKTGGKPAAKPAAAAAKPAAAASQEAEAPAASEAVLLKKLTLKAKSVSREDFQMFAMDLPEVQANADLLNQVIDDSDNGFWAKARAS